MKYKIAAILTAVFVFVTLMPMAAMAAAIDTARQGSVTVEMEYNNDPIQGMPVTVYQVTAVSSGSGLAFPKSAGFAGSTTDLSDISASADNVAAAAALLAWAQAHNLTGTSKNTGADGAATFSSLQLGLYLIVPGHVNGYYDIAPYLVMVPQQAANGGWTYDVTAFPKTEPQKIAETSPTPTPTASPSPTPIPPADNPNSPQLVKLPQTGTLNWPIPVMSALGLVCLSAGWILLARSKKGKG